MRISTVTAHRITEQEGAKEEASLDERSTATLVLLRAGELVPEARAEFGTYHDVFCEFFKQSLLVLSPTGPAPSRPHDTPDGSAADRPRAPPGPVQLQIISYNVVQSLVEPIEYPSAHVLSLATAVIISGSASNAFDDIAWINELIQFTKAITNSQQQQQQGEEDAGKHLKLIGICFGHQIICRALGAQVVRNSKCWELGIDHISLNSLGESILFDHVNHDPPYGLDLSDSKPHPGSSKLTVYQIHRDIVVALPPSTYNLGTSEKCEIQGIVKFTENFDPTKHQMNESTDRHEKDTESLHDNIRILTFQAHPEYHPTILSHLLNARTRFASDFSIIDRPTFNFALESLRKFPLQTDHHGYLIGAKILQILKII